MDITREDRFKVVISLVGLLYFITLCLVLMANKQIDHKWEACKLLIEKHQSPTYSICKE